MFFADLQIPPELISALARQGIIAPTPIQVAALPVLLAGKDAYLHAETGTGKTLAYLLPLFCRMDAGMPATQVLIVAPTHELAIQIQRQCCDLAQNAGWAIRALLRIGGTSTERQIDKLKKKPHLVVGSPGRIRELIAKGKLKTQHIRAVVMDEADRLLDEESLPAVLAIIHAAPGSRQLVFASATKEQHCTAVINSMAPDLVMLKTGAADLNAANDKYLRKQAMDRFRRGSIHVLIGSDTAARGPDIKGVTHIFNFDVLEMSKAYLHLADRSGRAGEKGLAVSLVTEVEARLIRRYQEELGIVMQCANAGRQRDCR